ncbi:MAG: M23 family metallopeptidase [Chitinophagaceae bacterium]|nr:M23 family metallopeptidase [Chitinophagaceae bacterium]
MNRICLLCLFLIGFSEIISAQHLFARPNYPTNYLFPLKIPIQLVGNFGECRPDHFHSGLDIRTNGQENLPVYAVEKGYISKVIVMPTGFGKAICVTHPGGFTTLYAHLNSFFPELQAYVKRRQYQTKSWRQEIVLMPHQFPVRRGQLIAKSGNTGSSQGPHLHMEIRKSKDDLPVNPLFFYPQLTDTKPPVFKKLAIYNAAQSIYEQDALLIKNLVRKHENFQVSDTLILPHESVYFGVEANDLMEVATGTLGIYEMQVYSDQQERIAWRMDQISYSATRYMNALVDYKTSILQKIWIQLGHILPGNRLAVYKKSHPEGGKISLTDGRPHRIQIKILDTHGNQSELLFWVRKSSIATRNTSCSEKLGSQVDATIQLHDLRVFLPSGALYDQVCKAMIQQGLNENRTPLYNLFERTVPMHIPIEVAIRPTNPMGSFPRTKLCFCALGENGQKGRGVAMRYENGWWVTTLVKSGKYSWYQDTIAPLIRSSHKSRQKIVSGDRLDFEITEESTQVDQVYATVGKQWICLEQRGNHYTYRVDEHFPNGLQTLMLKAWDANRNERTFTLLLNRI